MSHGTRLENDLKAEIDATLRRPLQKDVRAELMKMRSQIGKPIAEEEKADIDMTRESMMQFATAYAAWLEAGKPEGQEPSWKKRAADDKERTRDGKNR